MDLDLDLLQPFWLGVLHTIVHICERCVYGLHLIFKMA